MISVLPGFSGFVPSGFLEVFPKANVTSSQQWDNFNKTYSQNDLLEPTDPLFQTVGSKFIEIISNEFGTDHIYNADTYNEMNPRTNNSDYLQSSSSSVMAAMKAADPMVCRSLSG